MTHPAATDRLEWLVQGSLNAIKCWCESWDGAVYVSYSGGLDSEVLLHLARMVIPDIKGVFFNTGLEYHEIVAHVKSHNNIDIVRPKKSFMWVIENLGYPVGSKRIAKAIAALQNPSETNCKSRNLYLTGITSGGRTGSRFKIGQKWLPLVDSGIKVSHKCCDILKKEPAKRYAKETGLKTMIALTLGEGSSRDFVLGLNNSCNTYDTKHPTSYPLKNWTRADILSFVLQEKIKYCSVYGEIVKDRDGQLDTTREKRTGCVFCLFGISYDKPPYNRLQRLYKYHPDLWRFCMNKLPTGKICKLLNIPVRPQGFGL